MNADPTSNPDAPAATGPGTKDPFAHLRHELRTPINQIIGYSEMLQEEATDAGQEQFVPDLEKIHRAATNMLTVISENLAPGKFAPVTVVTEDAKMAKLVETLARPASMNAESNEKESEARLAGGRMLVVDDNELNRDMLTRRLEKHGCVVTTAENGRHALEWVRKAPFDLVLLDIMMPELDGYSVLQQMKQDAELRHIPVIMISALDEMESVIRCIEAGAEDFLPKPFNPTLLRARIGACLEKKNLRDQEQRTYEALVESQKHLAAELVEAADYVKSLLPPPLTGPITTEWRFVPSTQLGGDAFGYHWLDGERLAIYLLDVCGHGVGAALLSISVVNVLRSQSLPATDFGDPAQVLAALNEAFQMEKQNNMYFTIWYGVYHQPSRKIKFSSGGHPPAILIPPGGPNSTPIRLRTGGLVIGTMTGITYKSGESDVPAGSRLFVFSDGTYELQRPAGGMLTLEEYARKLADPACSAPSGLDRVIEYSRAEQARDNFDDDFSIMRIAF